MRKVRHEARHIAVLGHRFARLSRRLSRSQLLVRASLAARRSMKCSTEPLAFSRCDECPRAVLYFVVADRQAAGDCGWYPSFVGTLPHLLHHLSARIRCSNRKALVSHGRLAMRLTQISVESFSISKRAVKVRAVRIGQGWKQDRRRTDRLAGVRAQSPNPPMRSQSSYPHLRLGGSSQPGSDGLVALFALMVEVCATLGYSLPFRIHSKGHCPDQSHLRRSDAVET